jgi:beta-galactosidase
VNVRVVDKDGNLCPLDNRMIRFTVSGAGKYRASANGDPTCLEMFHLPQMQLFNGQLTTIVQAGEIGGTLTLEAKSKGVQSSKISIRVK